MDADIHYGGFTPNKWFCAYCQAQGSVAVESPLDRNRLSPTDSRHGHISLTEDLNANKAHSINKGRCKICKGSFYLIFSISQQRMQGLHRVSFVKSRELRLSFPSMFIFPLSNRIEAVVAEHTIRAFGLYTHDDRACLNAIRQAYETIQGMDYHALHDNGIEGKDIETWLRQGHPKRLDELN